MSALSNPRYQFAEFELEPAERRLLGNGKPIALTPKVFDTLVLLVENAGHVTRKDDLMKALWPRGYVDEATLSNHIWQIRRALGDTAKKTRFIETVPKMGYRFCAPVTLSHATAQMTANAGRVEFLSGPTASRLDPLPSTDDQPAQHAAPPPIFPASSNAAPGVAQAPLYFAAGIGAAALRRTARRYAPIGWGAVILAIALSLAVTHWRTGISPAHEILPMPSRPSIAFVGFNNLSKVADDAWLATALTSMLATEISATDSLRVIPYSSVQEATKSLTPPVAGGYADDALQQIRKQLDADYAVTGSYLIGTGRDDPTLRVDVTLQNLRTGAVIGTISKLSELSLLNGVVEQLGTLLRGKLGVALPSAETLHSISRAQPPTPEVARHIGIALEAMQHHDAAHARDELLDTVAQAPGFAPAYLYLSEAYTALGSRPKALAAAEQAAARADTLTAEQRLQVDAAVQVARYDWKAAAATDLQLVLLRPAQLEYRIAYVDALLAVGEIERAKDLVDEMLRLPGSADPRITLAAARVADARNDVHSSATLAAAALKQAQARELPALIAESEVKLATANMHLGNNVPAREELRVAIDGYRSIGNPRGEIEARRNFAAALQNLGQGPAARDEYQRAMALAQSIGDMAGVSAVYRDLTSMLWNAGDRDAAQVAARRALGISRETGDLRLQAWMVRALATIASDEAATDEVLDQYREVTELTERIHDPGGHVWSLATTADLLRIRGQLDDAAALCPGALAEAAVLTDPQFRIYASMNCAQVAMDRNEVKKARSLFEDTTRESEKTSNSVYAANSQMVLAQMDLDASNWAQARSRLENAVKGFASMEQQTGQADAEAMLAIGAQANGDSTLRDRAMAHAASLRAAATSRQEVYFVDIALAQLSSDAKGVSAAIERLRDIAADAERRHWLSWALEAKLAAWRLLQLQGDASAAAKLGEEIGTVAREHGFGRIQALLSGSAPLRQPTSSR